MGWREVEARAGCGGAEAVPAQTEHQEATMTKEDEMSIELTTTLRLLRERGACRRGYTKLRAALGKGWGQDAPIPLSRILETNGLDDALWVLDRAVSPVEGNESERRRGHLRADYAQHLLPIYEALNPQDPRVRNCIEMTRRAADGLEERGNASAHVIISDYVIHSASAALASCTYSADSADYAAAYAAEQEWQAERSRLVVGPTWTRALHDAVAI